MKRVKIKLLVCVALAIVIVSGCSVKTNNNSEGDVTKGNEVLKAVDASYGTVVALANSGNLYAIGINSYGNFGIGDVKELKNVKKIASNVKMFSNTAALYYLNNNNELYYSGLKLEGGANKEFEKIASNVKTFVTNSGFCTSYIDLNDSVYVKSIAPHTQCGYQQDYEKFTKVAENAKFIFNSDFTSGYITKNDELYYASTTDSSFIKIMGSVKKVSADAKYILTNDNKLYKVKSYKSNKADMDLLTTDVVDLYGDMYGIIFKKSDGAFYSEYSDNGYPSVALVESGESGIRKFNAKDIKSIIYYSSSYSMYVYLNNDNQYVSVKQVTNDKTFEEELQINNLGNNLETIEKIHKFIES